MSLVAPGRNGARTLDGDISRASGCLPLAVVDAIVERGVFGGGIELNFVALQYIFGGIAALRFLHFCRLITHGYWVAINQARRGAVGCDSVDLPSDSER